MCEEMLIDTIDAKINKLIQLVGTKSDGEEVYVEVPSGPDDQNKDANSITTQATKVKPQTLSNILTYIVNTKNKLLEDNAELNAYYERVKANKYLIDNFCSYANTALNIIDKARLIYHIRDDIFELGEKIKRLDEFSKQIDELKSMQNFVESRLDTKQQVRMAGLIKRAEEQKKEIVTVLEIYKEIIEFMNDKLVRLLNEAK